MKDAIFQRVREFLKIRRFSVNELSGVLKMRPSTLAGKLNGSRDLDAETIVLILEAFPKLSAEWLMRGEGPMEISEAVADAELQAVCIDQAKEIYQLRQRIAELEKDNKSRT